MDHECEVVARNNVLEDMLLHDSAAPTYLPFSLLKDITNDFSDDQLIGRGGFATVYKGRLWSGSVAVKKLHSNIVHIDEGKFMNEVECLMKVKHENIVRFLGYCSEGHGRISEYQGKNVMAEEPHQLLCFEYLQNGSLDAHINASSGHIEWIERCQIIKGICLGLYYLHKMSILHMDLKPANILLDYNMVPKIADFGLARWFGENQIPAITENIVGTIGYMAPEYRSTGVMTDKSDIYSLGVIIMEILTGKKEHCEENHGHVACACVLDSWKSRLEPSLADTALAQIEACAAISMACMDPEPENRPIIQDVLDKLNKIKTSDGFSENTERSMLVAQGIPHPSRLLSVKPLNLKFLDHLGNFVPACPVHLTNKTDHHVAFRLMPSDSQSNSCALEHVVYGGVVPPRSTCTLNLRTREIQEAWEEYRLQSRIMGNVLDFRDLRGQVHEVKMGALYVLEIKIVLKVPVTCNKCKACILGICSGLKGIKSLTYDTETCLLTVVGFADVVEVVATLQKKNHPLQVLLVNGGRDKGKALLQGGSSSTTLRDEDVEEANVVPGLPLQGELAPSTSTPPPSDPGSGTAVVGGPRDFDPMVLEASLVTTEAVCGHDAPPPMRSKKTQWRKRPGFSLFSRIWPHRPARGKH